MNRTHGLLHSLSAENRERILALSREVSFPAGERIFEEGGRAEHFWIIRTGAVYLDLHVPGRRAPTVEALGPGDLLGWSWLFAPYRWHLGAQALSPVRAREFDAEQVRALCEEDPVLGRELVLACAEVIAHRLTASRTRLLDLYGPHSAVRS
ncbi:cyclic nucleotide-binding domain-containing protein [Streptomyces sp. NPDC006733]|uniref:Crp/Fnr family transcriptional regulator n=1 Tax=Streptomyces sp. NPDC006733 TaxID=3155460 RepID=UPI0033C7F057